MGVLALIEFEVLVTFEEQDDQYLYYSDGTTEWRKGTRDGYFVYDKALTPTGFLGTEDTDWTNVTIII